MSEAQISVSKDEWKAKKDSLQDQLFNISKSIYNSGIPVTVIFEGWATAGKGDCIKVITDRQDPRGFRVTYFREERSFEKDYPWLRRFWMELPNYGQISIFDTSWYRRLLDDKTDGKVTSKEYTVAFSDILGLEKMLIDDGMVIIKYWLDISQKEQSARMKKLKKTQKGSWNLSKEDHRQNKNYKKHDKNVQTAIKKTSTDQAPWTIVDASDRNSMRMFILKDMIAKLTAVAKERKVKIFKGRK